MSRSPEVRVRFRGPLACFTRPELKVERVTYPVITPSAARGAIEAILWKPAIRWRVHRIHVLAPVRYISFKRNEVNSVVPADAARTEMNGGAPLRPFYADADRAQRNTVALRDVDYVVEASFSLTPRAGPEDNLKKFQEMFVRRVEKGQSFMQPYFGCREFPAEFLSASDAPPAIPEDHDLGLMLHDIEFGESNRPVFFQARMQAGTIEVPAFADREAAA